MTWPLSDAGISQTGGVVAASSLPATVTADVTSHTKGAWTELIAATGLPASGLWVTSVGGINVTSTDTSMLVDIGLGAAGSEQVVIANIPFGFVAASTPIWVPLSVPDGSRVAARAQAAVSADTIQLQVLMVNGGWHVSGGNRCTTYGADVTDSGGVTLTTVSGANAKGPWTEIAASTSSPMRWMTAMIIGQAGVSGWSVGNALVDFAYGAAGSEQILVADMAAQWTGSEFIMAHQLTVPVSLPTGTRLSARYQCTAVSSNSRPDVVVLGVD